MELLTSPRCPKFFSPRVIIPDSSRAAGFPSCPCQKLGRDVRHGQALRGGSPSPLPPHNPHSPCSSLTPCGPPPPCVLCVLQCWAWSVPVPLPPASTPTSPPPPSGEAVSAAILPLTGSPTLLTRAVSAARGPLAEPAFHVQNEAALLSDTMGLSSPRPPSQSAALDFRICADKKLTASTSCLDSDNCRTPPPPLTSRDPGQKSSSPGGPGGQQTSPGLPLDFSYVPKHACLKTSPEVGVDFRLKRESWCKVETPWSPASSRPPGSPTPRPPASSSPAALGERDQAAQRSLSPHPDPPPTAATRERRKLGCGRSKDFRCPYCVVSCSNRGQLVGHLRIHTGERPFVCRAAGCSKAFIRNEELTRHRRIHTGERPYPCPHCPKAFTRKDHLNKHAKVHANAAAL